MKKIGFNLKFYKNGYKAVTERGDEVSSICYTSDKENIRVFFRYNEADSFLYDVDGNLLECDSSGNPVKGMKLYLIEPEWIKQKSKHPFLKHLFFTLCSILSGATSVVFFSEFLRIATEGHFAPRDLLTSLLSAYLSYVLTREK